VYVLVQLPSEQGAGMHMTWHFDEINACVFACARRTYSIDPDTFVCQHADRMLAPGMLSAIPREDTSFSGVSLYLLMCFQPPRLIRER
jgi:hypothetical protein